ncbi:MAG: TlpA family protein disulfide reductase [Bacteriovoracaceae bacterium]
MRVLFFILFLASCSQIGFGPDDANFSAVRIPSNETSLTQIKPNKLTRFYQKYLSTKPAKWLAQKLPTNLHLPSSGPAQDYYNNSILWAVDNQERTLFGFRPINTTTGCNSGCSPVVFHLKFKEDGSIVDLIEDPNDLLRKKWHKPYTSQDKAKALKLAKTIPEELIKVLDPKILADELSVYPPATWTAYSDLLVKNSAYTSYRIVQAAYQIRDYLKTTSREKITEAQYTQFVNKHLNGRWSNISQLRNSMNILSKAVKHPNLTPSIKGMIFTNPQNVLLSLIAYGDNSDNETASEFLKNNEFKTTHRSVVCDLKKRLLNFEKGQNLLVKMGHNQKLWPKCNDLLDIIYPVLAAAKVNDINSAREFSSGMDLSEIPPVVEKDPALLQDYVVLTELLKNEKAMNKAYANLKTRFPLLKVKDINVPDDALRTAELSYRKEIKRAMLHADVPFPSFKAMSKNGALSLPQSEKRIYVFFATWCPHCKAKVKEWSEFSKEFWKSVALVEVFPKTQSLDRLQKFCEETNLDQNQCDDIIYIEDENERNKLYEVIGLAGVPRIILTREDQHVGFFDYKLPHHKGVDQKREIKWALEEASTSR